MVPYGIGLTGAALLKDASGQIQVNLLITTVAPARKHAYRAGKPVVLKGTFKKFSSTAGVLKFANVALSGIFRRGCAHDDRLGHGCGAGWRADAGQVPRQRRSQWAEQREAHHCEVRR